MGLYSDILSLILAVACLTVAYEAIWTPGRHLKTGGRSMALGVEAAIAFVLWALWLGEHSGMGVGGADVKRPQLDTHRRPKRL